MNAVRYLFPLLLLLFSFSVSATADAVIEQITPPKTYRLQSEAALRAAPDGAIKQVWDAGTTFTSNIEAGDWIRITGHFPDGSWRKYPEPLWVAKPYAIELYRQPPDPPRKPGIGRYIVVDKSRFELRVFETEGVREKLIHTSRVSLGMDGCLPEEQGGRCYYTEPGEYQVRWKIHDPEGIEWCIPKSMEKQYPEDIARGDRCFRGSIGNHALNIGKSYAIHGTNKPHLLGQKVSHGCIRTLNSDVEKLYELMRVGDKVIIRD